MTRFQTILSGLGGLAALYALAAGLLSGTPDIAIMVASLVLLLAVARRFAGVMRIIRLILVLGWPEWQRC